MRRRALFILNGISRRRAFFRERVLPLLSSDLAVEVLETRHSGHAVKLAARATREEPHAIVVAGGDGTLHEALNGILAEARAETPLPALGVVPLGTGNDFARTCGLTADPASLAERLLREPQPTDVGKLTCRDGAGNPAERYFINHCSLGMGPEVVRRLEAGGRALGPALTYLKAILQTFFSHHPEAVAARSGSWAWVGRARVVAVANGRTFGNAICLAPDGRPDDGALSTFIVGELPLPKFLYYLRKAKSGAKIDDPEVRYGTTERLELSSELPCPVEADGELAGFLPARIEVLPRRIRFLR